MFETLLASGPASPPFGSRVLLSAGVHAAIVAGAIALTRSAQSVDRARPDAAPVVYLTPAVPPPPPSPRTDRVPSNAVPLPPPPPVAIHDPAFSSLLGLPPRFEDPPGRPALLPSLLPALRASRPGGVAPTSAATGEPLVAESVDQPVDVLEQHPPRYPAALERAGIAGRVELEYVVDTLGRAEPGSVRVIESGHPAFEAAARTAVLESRYRPAWLGGRPVRQLVRQRLSFRDCGDVRPLTSTCT
jgi:TonB family protein